MVKQDRSQSLLPNHVFYYSIKIYCSFRFQILDLELIRFICTSFSYDLSFDIWSKFPGTNSFKKVVISFSSLFKWLLYAALLLWQNLISRRNFITTSNRYSASKTAKISKTNYFLTNHHVIPKQAIKFQNSNIPT